MKKWMLIVFLVIIALMLGIAGFSLWVPADVDVPETNVSLEILKMYEHRNTSLSDASAVKKLVDVVNITDYPIHSTDLWDDMRFVVNFKVDDRSNHRLTDSLAINKTAALIFALVPDCNELSFFIYDDYGDVTNSETSFSSRYYDRNRVCDSDGMEAFTADFINNSTENEKSFEEYYNTAMNIKPYYKELYKLSDFDVQMFEFIGDDCEVVTNSGISATVKPDENGKYNSEDYKILENICGPALGKYSGKEFTVIEHDIRNFKTNEYKKCVFVYYMHEDKCIFVGSKFIDETVVRKLL